MSTKTHSKKRQNYSTIPHNKITVIAICRIAVHFRIAQKYKQEIAYSLSIASTFVVPYRALSLNTVGLHVGTRDITFDRKNV